MSDFGPIAYKYDEWKLRSPFYEDYEKKIVLENIRRYTENHVTNKFSVLDIGTGTGFWIYEIDKFVERESELKISNAIGIDVSRRMINIAQEKRIPNSNFIRQDITNNNNQLLSNYKFDLIISGLSMDYIGVNQTLTFIKNNLKNHGQAFIWYFDPKRYSGDSNIITKKWNVLGENFKIYATRFSLDNIQKQSKNLSLHSVIKNHKLPILDGIERELIFQITTHNNVYGS